jgi:hypothetical protein
MPKVPEQPAARPSIKINLSELPRHGPVIYDLMVVLTLDQRRETKWSGTLFNSVSETDAEKLCEVTIQDHTPAQGGLKLDLFLQKSDSIRLKKFHDLTDLDLLLPSFQHIAQFASLVPCEEKDKEAFSTMQKYLLLKEKVCALQGSRVSTLTISVHLLHPFFCQRDSNRNEHCRVHVCHSHEQASIHLAWCSRAHGKQECSPYCARSPDNTNKEVSRGDGYP